MGAFTNNLRRVEAEFSRDDLARVCVMPERDFEAAYDMTRITVPQSAPEDFYLFRNHGSRVLAVAHLDTVGAADQRTARFIETEAGPVVYSRALDDRLGAYIILHLLPALGIQYDILLTVGEESGLSTASFFESEKDYDYVIEFDRGGTDVVMYQYDDDDTRKAVRASGAQVGEGSFSDVCYLEHLGVKGFNWGVGYRDYHGPRAHAYLDDTFDMVARYLKFHRANYGVTMPHFPAALDPWFAREDRYADDNRPVDLYDEDGNLVEVEDYDWGYSEYPSQEELREWDRRMYPDDSDALDADWLDGVRAEGRAS